MEQKIKDLLKQIVHPESGVNIVESHIVEDIRLGERNIAVTLLFARSRDPFAVKIKQQVEHIVAESYADYAVTVLIREGAPKKVDTFKQNTTTKQIGKVVAIASGKGGVGKSTLTANLATTLRDMGYKVGLLDADIYGPSQPKMFGCEGYVPDAEVVDGKDYIIPALCQGIKIMSIGFFVNSQDALLWRGAMCVNALRQMIHQTQWGELDFLLIDLPPGTGDIHLSVIGELEIDGSVIISTPQAVAVADVIRGVEMFRNDQVNIPILGIVENMAWFTPAELPDAKYYIFGKGGAAKYAAEAGVELLGEIPIIQSIVEGGDSGQPAATLSPMVAHYYFAIAQKAVDKLSKSAQ